MTLQASGSISLADIATEFGDTTPNSMDEFYRGGSLVDQTHKAITYTELFGNNGSPSLGTRYPNSDTFSYSWHIRTFSGDVDGWGTSMVRETDEVVAYLKSEGMYVNRMGWRYSGNNAFTVGTYYFRIIVTGNHRTSPSGTVLTGTQYYTGAIAYGDLQGDAVFTRRSGDPGTPNSTSINNGSTSQLEGSIYYLYDLQDCDVQWHFNSYQPGTSSASFYFRFDADDSGSTTGQQGINVNETVPTSGTIDFADFYSSGNIT